MLRGLSLADARGAGGKGKCVDLSRWSVEKNFYVPPVCRCFGVSARPLWLAPSRQRVGRVGGEGCVVGWGGGGSLVERGGIFWTGAEIPSSTQVDCGVRGRFFSARSCELAILATQSHAQVMPPCDCVANSVRPAVEYREIVATGGKLRCDGVEK